VEQEVGGSSPPNCTSRTNRLFAQGKSESTELNKTWLLKSAVNFLTQ
jgi:hypothetical protein